MVGMPDCTKSGRDHPMGILLMLQRNIASP